MHFKFSPNILNRLGEELIPNPDQGIIELVKNSYDADATECTVELLNTHSTGGSLIISDNGVGMNISAISEGWLVLGRSKKATREPTPLGRLPVGDKGLGRLAALRQGSQVTLKTRPKNEPGVEYSLEINWNAFEQADVVEDVSFDVQKSSTYRSQGSDIIIRDLRIKFGRREIKRLARELLLLADPFDNRIAFHPRLIAPGFADLEKQVSEAYFDDAEYHLKAELNAEGIAEARLSDWKRDILSHTEHRNLSQKVYKTVPAEFELWVFQLNPQSFSAKNKKDVSREIRDWLAEVGGVHLYHRGLRVKPYGDQEDDWLKINFARARNPEVRPSTRTVIGRVIANDPDDILIQKTDRLGFIENEAFLELRQFAVDVLEWMADVRLQGVEEKRRQAKQESVQDVAEVKESIDKVIEAEVPKESRATVRKVIQQYERARDRETKALREDLQLYRSLATAGTTAAVFAHESGKKITLIEKIVNRIENQGKKLLAEKYENSLKKPVEKLYQISKALQNFVRYPIHLLKKEKRSSGLVGVHEVLEHTIELFESFLDEAKVDVILEKFDGNPYIIGSVALLESIVTNLLTNTINAFNVEGARHTERKVIIKTEVYESFIFIKVLDNGSGIRGIDLDKIWLPGKTTTPGGTGFGLTIVKDSVADLGGKIHAIPHGELGGAEFIVQLPLKQV